MPSLSEPAGAPRIAGFAKTTITATNIILSGWAFYEMRIKAAVLDPRMMVVVDTLHYPESPDILVHTSYTGNFYIDYGLRFLVTAFLPGASGFHDPAALVLSAYFLMSFFTLFTIYTVEAGKAGAKGSAIYSTSIWAIFFQSVGGAVIIPLLHLFLLRQFWKPEYYTTANKVSTGYAKALVPSLVLGYLLPTIAVYLPSSDPNLVWKQKLIAFWQITPFIVNILLLALGTLFASTDASPEQAAQTAQTNISRIYTVCFIASALTHVGMFYAKSVWSLSFTQIFLPRDYMLDAGVADPLHYVFQIDYVGIFASGLMMAFVSLWFLNSTGHAQSGGSTAWFLTGSPTSSGVRIVLGLTIGSVLFGPAATIALTSLVREKVLSTIQARKKVA